MEVDFLSWFGKRLDEVNWSRNRDWFPSSNPALSGEPSCVEQEMATLVFACSMHSVFDCLIVEAVFVMLHYDHMVWHGFHALRDCFILACRCTTEVHDTGPVFFPSSHTLTRVAIARSCGHRNSNKNRRHWIGCGFVPAVRPPDDSARDSWLPARGVIVTLHIPPWTLGNHSTTTLTDICLQGRFPSTVFVVDKCAKVESSNTGGCGYSLVNLHQKRRCNTRSFPRSVIDGRIVVPQLSATVPGGSHL